VSLSVKGCPSSTSPLSRRELRVVVVNELDRVHYV